MEATTWSVRPVAADETSTWGAMTAASSGDPSPAAAADRARHFAAEPVALRNMAHLVWRGDRPLGRLRLQLHQVKAEAWAVGLHPQVAAEGLQPAFLAAVERRARREGAQHLVLALSLPLARSLEATVVAAGYRLVKRRVTMEARLVRRPAPCPRPMRPARRDDPGEAATLARVMLESYAGGIDFEGETLDEALTEVRRVMDDGWGPFLPACSLVLLGDEGEPAGAALVTQEVADETWLCEVFIQPRYRGQGCARPLIQAAINACLDQGYTRMGLMVTLGNVPAEGLYRRLGFEEEEGSEEHHFEKELTGQ